MIKVIPSKFFEREFNNLFKKYKNIVSDVEKVVNELKVNPKNGIALKNGAYKIRVKNSDNNKGKSGGYRIITYILRDERVYLIGIYSKSEQESMSDQDIKERIKGLLK